MKNIKYFVTGLNHGLATYQKQNDILASVGAVWDQINKKNICKEIQNHIERPKNSLRALAFSLIDLGNYQVFKDKKKLEVIKNLRKELVILKPDKGNGTVLIGTNDYYITVEKLFPDKSKFEVFHDDLTPARLSSIQRYLKKLNNRNELNDEVFKNIQPQNAKLARPHGVPKVLKTFNSIPFFRPVIDTTRTTHYSVGKYLSELLNTLTQNMYTVKDSFDAANKINQILPSVQNSDKYVFFSLDVVSLFTNVPLKKTVDIILKRIYTDKEITSTLT